MIVRERTVLHGDVAGVGDDDRVGDLVADLDAARRARGLFNLQRRCRRFGRDRCGCGCGDVVVLRILAGRGDRVQDLARIDVALRDRVGVGDRLRAVRREIERRLGERDQRIGHDNILDRDITGVGNDDRVSDLVADLCAARRARGLRDRQRRSRRDRRDRRGCGCGDVVVLRILTGRGDRVQDLARVDVALRDRVGVGDRLRAVRREIERRFIDGNERIGKRDALDRDVTVVGDDDRVGDHVADLRAARLACGLGDRQRRSRRDRRDRRGCGCGDVVVLRVLTGRGDRVQDLARVDVALLHRVGVGDRLRAVRREIERRFIDGNERIGKRDALDRDVAGVGDDDRVGDHVADLRVARLARGLRDRQRRSRRDRRDRRGCGCGDVVVLRILTGRGDRIHDLARVDVALLHRVGVGDRLRAVRREIERRFIDGNERIGKRDALDRDVAGVGDDDRVGDHVADLRVARLARGLRDRQRRSRRDRRDRCGCGCRHVFAVRILTGRGDRVQDLARIDVALRDRVGVGDRLRAVRREIERRLGERDQRIGHDNILDRDVAGVGNDDRVGDLVADLRVARLARGLRDRQPCIRIRRLDGDGCGAGHVVVLRILTGRGDRVDDLARVDVALLHRVGVGDRLRAVRREIERRFIDGNERIGKRDALDRDVAGVGDDDRVGDHVADLRVARLARGLRDRQRRSRRDRRDRRGCGCGDVVVLRILTGRGDRVQDLARVDVALRDRVGVGDRLRAVRREIERRFIDGNERIGKRDALDRDVAGVGDDDRVGDHVADLRVARLARGLRDRQRRSRRDRRDRRGCGCGDVVVLRILTGRGDRIHDLARIDVALRDRVGVGDRLRAVRREIERRFIDGNERIGKRDALDRDVAGVGDDDRVGDHVADLRVARLARGLRDRQRRSRRDSVDRDRVGARDIRALRVFACRSCSVDDLACVDVILRDLVGIFIFARCARREVERSRHCLVHGDRDERVVKRDALDRHVAGIRNGDDVANDIADLYVVVRIRSLFDRQSRLRRDRMNRNGIVVGHIIALRILTGCLCGVRNAARIDMLLRDIKVIDDFLGLTRRKRERLNGRSAVQRVFEHNVLDRDVAGIRYQNQIRDHVSDLVRHIVRIRILFDRQLCVCRDRRDRCGCGCGDVVVLRILTGRGDRIHDLARVDVALLHRVGVGDRLRAVRREIERRFINGNERIAERNALDRYVAAVGDDDRIGDHVADLCVARLARGLRNRQSRSRCGGRDRCACFDFRRVVAAHRCRVRLDRVHDLARVDVRLRDGIGVSERCFFARSELERLAGEIRVIVDELAALDCDVADVLDRDRVGDRVARRHAAHRRRLLGDADLRICSDRRDRRIRGGGHFSIRMVLTGRRYSVLDLARIDVRLLHRVGVGDRLAVAGLEIERRFIDGNERIGKRDALDRDVTVVGDDDRVGDHVADLRAARLACGLGDRNRRSCRRHGDRCARGLFERIDLRGDRVGEAARCDVCAGDGVGRRCGDGFACRNVLKDALAQRDAFNLREGDRLRLGVDVRRGDGERDGVADVVRLRCVVRSLRDDQVGRNVLIGDRQRSRNVGHLIVVGDLGQGRFVVVVDRCPGRCDALLIYVHVDLATVERNARQRVAADQTFDRDLCGNVLFIGHVVLALQLSVVNVRLRFDRDRQRRLGDDELTVRDPERHVKVAVRILNQISDQHAVAHAVPDSHLIRSGVDAFDYRIRFLLRYHGDDLHSARIVQRIIAFNAISLRLLFRSVIHEGLAVADDMNRDRFLIDLQRAEDRLEFRILRGDVVARGIRDRVGERIVVRRVVRNGRNARSRRRDRDHVARREREDLAGLIRREGRAVVRDDVFFLLMRFAVIVPLAVRRRDGDRSAVGVGEHDGHIAGDNALHGEILSDVRLVRFACGSKVSRDAGFRDRVRNIIVEARDDERLAVLQREVQRVRERIVLSGQERDDYLLSNPLLLALCQQVFNRAVLLVLVEPHVDRVRDVADVQLSFFSDCQMERELLVLVTVNDRFPDRQTSHQRVAQIDDLDVFFIRLHIVGIHPVAGRNILGHGVIDFFVDLNTGNGGGRLVVLRYVRELICPALRRRRRRCSKNVRGASFGQFDRQRFGTGVLRVVVVGPGLGTSDGNDVVGDLQRAFLLRDRVVGRLRIAVQRVGERVRRFADQRARSGDAVRRAFALDKAHAADLDVGFRIVLHERFAVIDLLGACAGQRDRARQDRRKRELRTDLRRADDTSHRIDTISNSLNHGLSDIGQRRPFVHTDPFAVLLDVSFDDHFEVLRNAVARDRCPASDMGLSIVVSCIGIRTGAVVPVRIDRQRSGNNGGNHVVARRVFRNGIRIQQVAFVVILRNHHVLERDRIIAGKDAFAVCVHRGSKRQTCRIGGQMMLIRLGHRFSDIPELAAVACGAVGCRQHDARRRNLQRAGDLGDRKLRGHVIALCILDDRVARDDVRRFACIRASRIARHNVFDRIGDAVLRERKRLHNAGDRLFGSVVGEGCAVRGQRERESFAAVGDRQRAGNHGDLIVLCERPVIQRIGEGIFAVTDLRLGAGDAVRCAFAGNESFAADRNGIVRQRRAVVFLRIVRGGQGDRALLDRNRTGHGRNHRVLRRDINGIVVSVDDLIRERVVLSRVVTEVSDARLGRGDNDLVARREREDQTGRIAFHRVERCCRGSGRYFLFFIVIIDDSGCRGGRFRRAVFDRVDLFLMKLTVIGPFLRRGRDLDLRTVGIGEYDLSVAVDRAARGNVFSEPADRRSDGSDVVRRTDFNDLVSRAVDDRGDRHALAVLQLELFIDVFVAVIADQQLIDHLRNTCINLFLRKEIAEIAKEHVDCSRNVTDMLDLDVNAEAEGEFQIGIAVDDFLGDLQTAFASIRNDVMYLVVCHPIAGWNNFLDLVHDLFIDLYAVDRGRRLLILRHVLERERPVPFRGGCCGTDFNGSTDNGPVKELDRDAVRPHAVMVVVVDPLLGSFDRDQFILDHEFAGDVRNYIIGRNDVVHRAGNICGIDPRAGRNDLVLVFADERFLTVQRDLRQAVVGQQTFNRDLLVKVRGVGCVVFALRFAVVGVGLCVRGDRQRQRIVYDDFVAACLHRDRPGRVIGIRRQVKAGETGQERRRGLRRVLRIDHSGFRHVLRDLGGRALQVVVHGDRRGIELPYRVQRDDRAVFGREVDDLLRVGIGRRRCVRIGAPAEERVVRAGVRVRGQVLRLVIGERLIRHLAAGTVVLVEHDGVVDRLPDRVQIVVGTLFVRGDVGCRAAVVLEVRAVPCDPRFGRVGALCPAEELVSFIREGVRRLDHDRLVDREELDARRAVVQRVGLDDVTGAVVRIPVDVRRSILFLIGVLRAETDRVGRGLDHRMRGIRSRGAGLRVGNRQNVVFVVRVHPFGDEHLRVRLENFEGRAGVDLDRGVDVCRAGPLLNDPVCKDLRIVGRRGCGARRSRRLILIEQTVDRSVGPAVHVIDDADALGALDLAAPARIQIEAAVDPDTVVGRVLVLAARRLAVFVQLRRTRPVVCIRDRGVVDLIRVELPLVRVLAGLRIIVLVPADQLVIVAACVDVFQLLADVQTERGRLIAHVEGRVAAGVRMEEHAVLLQMPLRVDFNAARGHLGAVKAERTGAGLVDVPAHEVVIAAVEARLGRVFRFGKILSVEEGAVGIQHALRTRIHNLLVAVHIDAVHKREVCGIAIIVNMQRMTADVDRITVIAVLIRLADRYQRAIIDPVRHRMESFICVRNDRTVTGGIRLEIVGCRIAVQRFILLIINLERLRTSGRRPIRIIVIQRNVAGPHKGVQERLDIIGAAVLRIVVNPHGIFGPGVAVICKRRTITAGELHVGLPGFGLAAVIASAIISHPLQRNIIRLRRVVLRII